jgi:hypothetical protein
MQTVKVALASFRQEIKGAPLLPGPGVVHCLGSYLHAQGDLSVYPGDVLRALPYQGVHPVQTGHAGGQYSGALRPSFAHADGRGQVSQHGGTIHPGGVQDSGPQGPQVRFRGHEDIWRVKTNQWTGRGFGPTQGGARRFVAADQGGCQNVSAGQPHGKGGHA